MINGANDEVVGEITFDSLNTLTLSFNFFFEEGADGRSGDQLLYNGKKY